MVYAARKPSLHVEQIVYMQIEAGMISSMVYIGGRFNLIVVGSWNTNVLIHSCTSLKKQIEINLHNEIIVALDYVLISENKFILQYFIKKNKQDNMKNLLYFNNLLYFQRVPMEKLHSTKSNTSTA